MDNIQQLKQWIDGSDRIVFFGGAGVSTESGIPDFRSVDGLYNQKYFLMYKHTLLIDNGFGSRQRLLFRLKFRAALGRPFNNLFHTGLHQHLLSGMIRNYLLFFLIGFVILYFTTGNRCCQSFFRKVSAGF